jgi:hypothetical protein
MLQLSFNAMIETWCDRTVPQVGVFSIGRSLLKTITTSVFMYAFFSALMLPPYGFVSLSARISLLAVQTALLEATVMLADSCYPRLLLVKQAFRMPEWLSTCAEAYLRS